MSLPGLTTASLSDVGRVRTQNEDSFGEFSRPDGWHLFVVADGMGGHRAGETASRVTVETISDVFSTSKAAPDEILRETLEASNARLYRMASDSTELRGMGTTAVLLLVCPGGAGFVAHVGDSRLYRYREHALRALTEDHSVVAELQRRGLISADEAAVHPRRNEIMRSVGVEATVAVETRSTDVSIGDRYLLCSDGLSGMLDETEIAVILDGTPPEQAARELIDRANEHGGHDNVTVQVVDVVGEAVAIAPTLRRGSTVPASRAESNTGGRSALGWMLGLVALVAALLLVLLLTRS